MLIPFDVIKKGYSFSGIHHKDATLWRRHNGHIIFVGVFPDNRYPTGKSPNDQAPPTSNCAIISESAQLGPEAVVAGIMQQG